MPHKGGGEVLRGACALALGDEPLAGGVEYRALEFSVEQPELGIALHPQHQLLDKEIAFPALAGMYLEAVLGFDAAVLPVQLLLTSAAE